MCAPGHGGAVNNSARSRDDGAMTGDSTNRRRRFANTRGVKGQRLRRHVATRVRDRGTDGRIARANEPASLLCCFYSLTSSNPVDGDGAIWPRSRNEARVRSSDATDETRPRRKEGGGDSQTRRSHVC